MPYQSAFSEDYGFAPSGGAYPMGFQGGASEDRSGGLGSSLANAITFIGNRHRELKGYKQLLEALGAPEELQNKGTIEQAQGWLMARAMKMREEQMSMRQQQMMAQMARDQAQTQAISDNAARQALYTQEVQSGYNAAYQPPGIQPPGFQGPPFPGRQPTPQEMGQIDMRARLKSGYGVEPAAMRELLREQSGPRAIAQTPGPFGTVIVHSPDTGAFQVMQNPLITQKAARLTETERGAARMDPQNWEKRDLDDETSFWVNGITGDMHFRPKTDTLETLLRALRPDIAAKPGAKPAAAPASAAKEPERKATKRYAVGPDGVVREVK